MSVSAVSSRLAARWTRSIAVPPGVGQRYERVVREYFCTVEGGVVRSGVAKGMSRRVL
jgi:hypothetical protein